jgi:hypothetical protein
MSDEQQRTAAIEGLRRMQQALQATLAQHPESEYRTTASAYLVLVENTLNSALGDANWLDKPSEEVLQFNEFTNEVLSAASAHVWARVLRACYAALKGLPGEPAWKPKNPPPPP